MSNFNFNMMDSAGYGFYRVWVERSYLLKLAAIPLMIKFACMITVMVLDIDDNILRQGLILFPGVLAEGWVLAQFLRTLLKGERWPTILPADIDDTLLDKLLLRARGIVAATLAYGLIALGLYLVRYLTYGVIFGDFHASQEDIAKLLHPPEAAEANQLAMNPLMFFPLMAMFVGLFWAFRLVWVYIPLSVLMPADEYLKKVTGFMSSVKMVVLYFCTMTPIMFVVIIISNVVFGAFGASAEGDDSVARFIMVFFAVIADSLVGLVSTAAFVWAMKDFLPKNTDLLKDLPKLSGEK